MYQISFLYTTLLKSCWFLAKWLYISYWIVDILFTMNMIGVTLFSIIWDLALRTWTKAKHYIPCGWFDGGILACRALHWAVPTSYPVTVQIRWLTTTETAQGQYFIQSIEECSMHSALSIVGRFTISVTPSDHGELCVVMTMMIPSNRWCLVTIMKVHWISVSVKNYFSCLPASISWTAFQSSIFFGGLDL